jgi:hypothetical protein
MTDCLCCKLGRPAGIEPATTRSTIWCSTAELRPPCRTMKVKHKCCSLANVTARQTKRGRVSCPVMLAGGQGFEPRLTDPKSVVLPLDDPPSGKRCRGPDLNWGHQHFQCCALPTELPRPATNYLHCLLTLLQAYQKGRPLGRPRERAMRFELTTFSLARRRSTTELRPHIYTAQTGTKWTRSDSNRRSSPCKGDAFPLGHGPLPGHTHRLKTSAKTQCRREDSNLHT